MAALKPAPFALLPPRASFLAKLFIYLLPSLYTPAIIVSNAQLSPGVPGSSLRRNGTRASLSLFLSGKGSRLAEYRAGRDWAYYTVASKEPDIGAGHGRRQQRRRRRRRPVVFSFPMAVSAPRHVFPRCC